MSVLEGKKPENVLKFFEEIASIPHGSGNVEQISDYLVKFANDRELKCRQDEKKKCNHLERWHKGLREFKACYFTGTHGYGCCKNK